MFVQWRTLQEKRPKKEMCYATTVKDMFGPAVSHANWWKGHFWRFGNIVDDEVLAWADGLEPYREEK